jgi:hypothetical protein
MYVRLNIFTNNYNQDSAWPFRKPVRKSDAQDYYEVIHDPMDLSTIHKKIKNSTYVLLNMFIYRFRYNSKEDFEADLRLMFNNCRLYNTDTESIYRKCCLELEMFTVQLLHTLPVPKKDTKVDPFERDLRWNALTIKERLPILQSRQIEMSKKIGDQMAVLPTQDSLTSFIESSKKDHSFFPEYTHPIAVPDTLISEPTNTANVVPTRNKNSQLTRNVHKLFELMNNPLKDDNSTADTTTENASRNLLTPLISLLLAHEGFSAVNSLALDVLVDLLEGYLLRFGKVLNSHVSTNTNHSTLTTSLHRGCIEMNSYDGRLSITDLKNIVEKEENQFRDNLSAVERHREDPTGTSSAKMEDDFLTQDDL